jgi:hypothetical protein
MSTASLKMKLTMETMLSNSGYSVQFQIHKRGYTATCNINRAIMTLDFPDTLTPGEVVWNVLDVLNRLNAKDVEAREGE